MVRDYKKDILDIQTFLENRPDMEVHSESAIQSAIYSSASLLNGETNGNIEVVWNYNHGEDRQTSDTRYRSDYELNQIVEAFIVQTQYTLNIGNDYSIGGGSYSIGNINSSFSRPESRDVIAPGVIRLLQNARVYQTQSYFSSGEKVDCECGVDYDADYITRNIGDMRYVKKEQSVNLSGYIAQIDNNGLVDWVKATAIGVPSDLGQQLDTLKLGISTNKQNITNNADSIATNAKNIATNSTDITNLKTKTQENTNNIQTNANSITNLQNQHNQDKTQIDNSINTLNNKVDTIETALRDGKILHIENDTLEWAANHSYSVGALVEYNDIIYISKQNENINKIPNINADWWVKFSDIGIDLSQYYTKNEIIALLGSYVKQETLNQILEQYYSKSDIDNMLNQKADKTQLNDYVTNDTFNASQQEQNTQIQELSDKVATITGGQIEGVKVASFEVEANIENKDIVGADLSQYALQSWVTSQLANYVRTSGNQTIGGNKTFSGTTTLGTTTIDSSNGLNIKTGSNTTNVKAISGGGLTMGGVNVASQSWVTSQLSSYATQSWVTSQIPSTSNFVTISGTQTLGGKKFYTMDANDNVVNTNEIVNKNYVYKQIQSLRTTTTLIFSLKSYFKKKYSETISVPNTRWVTFEYAIDSGSLLYNKSIVSLTLISTTMTTTNTSNWYKWLMTDVKLFGSTTNGTIAVDFLKLYDTNDDSDWYANNFSVLVEYKI